MADAPVPASPIIKQRRGRWLGLLLVLLLMGGGGFAVYDGATRIPAPRARGSALMGPSAAPAGSTLKVATFNIHGCVGIDGRLDPSRVALALRGQDVVGLEEVHSASDDPNDNSAAAVGYRLNIPFLFTPTERRWWHNSFGNGLLCDLTIDAWQTLPLSRGFNRSYRNALVLSATWDKMPLHILVTHLDRAADRSAQLEEVKTMFLRMPAPAILLADLNTTAADEGLQKFLHAPGVLDAYGQATGDRSPRIDWILVRGLSVRRAGSINNGASDHPVIWAELERQP